MRRNDGAENARQGTAATTAVLDRGARSPTDRGDADALHASSLAESRRRRRVRLSASSLSCVGVFLALVSWLYGTIHWHRLADRSIDAAMLYQGGTGSQRRPEAYEGASDIDPHQPKIHLFITTHFSEGHVRYFHCCWPILVRRSPLIRSAHVIVASTNTTPVDETELRYLQNDLFAANPSFRFRYPTDDEHLRRCGRYWRLRYSTADADNATLAGRINREGPLKMPVNYKQCMANEAMRLGLSLRWIPSSRSNGDGDGASDWIIRLNPDVLIRSSAWLQSTLSTPSVDAVFVSCGPKTRQIHTDFFAVRARSIPENAFQGEMMKVRGKVNHERTAFRAFRHLLATTNGTEQSEASSAGTVASGGENRRFRYLPDADPSEGSCRVRGRLAPVYHVHDSCLADVDSVADGGETAEQPTAMTCSALDGWLL